jgi:hypothetical protein
MKRALSAACLVLACLAAFPRPVHAQASPSDAIFDDAKLHRVDLYVNSRDWYFLQANYQGNDYYPANFRWNGQTVRNVAIRSRGFGSRNQRKPGLRVDFNRYTTGQTFLGLNALVLDNLTQDPSLLHELVTMKVFRRLGLQASRESLAMLYVNNEYMGVYAIIEEPDAVAMGRMYGDSNGYLYEYKWTMDWHFEDLGTDLAPYQPLFEAKTRETESASALYQPIVAMVQAFNDASDEDFDAAAAAHIDVELFLRHAAIQTYLSEIDGLLGSWGLNNFYLYRRAGSQRHFVVPWDEDNAFFGSRYPVDPNQQANVLMRRLMERDTWRQFYYDAMLGVASSMEEGAEPIEGWPGEVGGGWLEREISRLRGLVHDAALADPRTPWTSGEVQAAWDSMVAFARERGSFVRPEIARVRR